MSLSNYFASEGAKTLTALSLELGVTKGRLSQLRDSDRWPPNLAMRVEEATGGALDAAVLSPTVARARSLAAPRGKAAKSKPK